MNQYINKLFVSVSHIEFVAQLNPVSYTQLHT